MSTTIPLTINLPQDLVNASQQLIKLGKAKYFEDFITIAIQNELLKNNLSLTSEEENRPLHKL